MGLVMVAGATLALMCAPWLAYVDSKEDEQ